MNYGLLNFKAQNGKPGIFFNNESSKKANKKVDYKTRKQNFQLRNHPWNLDRKEPERDNILKPIEKNEDEIETEKPKKPQKNFIQRNRERIGTKGKKGRETEQEDGNKTVTLTQEQLNAILASVGKVASGKEDKLKISIDSKHNEVLIESPRRRDEYHSDDETEKHHRDRTEKEHSKKSSRHKKDEDSIYAFLNNDTSRSKKDGGYNDKHDRNKKSNDREHSRERKQDREYSRERKQDRDRISYNRERSKERNKQKDQDKHSRENSLDRGRSRDRYKHSPDRDHSRNSNHSYEPDYRHKKLENSTERILKDLKRKVEEINNNNEKDKHKDIGRKDTSRLEPYSKDQIDENVSPREIAGIPVSLPWKHMTKAERRRLMIAREKVIMEAEKRKEEETKSKWREMVKEETEKLQKKSRSSQESHREHRRSPSHSPPRSREHSRERHERRRSRNRSRERYHSRERSHERRHSGERSRERRRRRSQSDERQNSVERRSPSRSKEHSRERTRDRHRRSPSPDDRHESQPESVPSTVPTRAQTNMSLAEKKKLQWERERAESQAGYMPWGKPGAGAPLRTRSGKLAADYRARQEDGVYETIKEESETVHFKKSKTERPDRKDEKEESNYSRQPSNVPTNVPAAMRSSFIFGQSAPDADMYESTKEQERKQWLKDLEKQREEKREQQMKDYENTVRKSNDTWADKFQNDQHPAKQDTVRGDDAMTMESARVNSAPGAQQTQPNPDEERTYIRGQNVFMDPVTKKELDEKRQRQLEHQRAVMEQVQEKQRQKQIERERKMKEDAEEERKLQAERDRLQHQFEMDQNKIKQKEMRRQEEIDRLKAAMDEAAETALREKYSKKMQHLEQGGHDTSQLKAHLAAVLKEDPSEKDHPSTTRHGYESVRNQPNLLAKITPRAEQTTSHVVPTHVPGLNLEFSPRGVPQTGQYTQKESHHEHLYTENRVLTPNQYRKHGYQNREFGTQTGMNPQQGEEGDEFPNDIPQDGKREVTDVGIMYKIVNGKRVRVKSAPREELKKHKENTEGAKKPRPEKGKGKKPLLWNYQNKEQKQPIKQSQKDPFYERKQAESKVRRKKREQELQKMVEKNRAIIPTERVNRTPGHSRDGSPASEGGRTPRSVAKQYSLYSVRRARSHSPERNDSRTGTRTLERTESPLNRKSPVSHRSVSPAPSGARGRSPPIPALRHRNYHSDRNTDTNVLQLDQNFTSSLVPINRLVNTKYNDSDPLEIPVGNSDFVPFMRTVDILDPAKAGSPLPISREATQVTNARKAYIKGMKPGDYGNRVDNYQDRMRMPNEPKSKDPIFNPSLVTEHPTQRQDAILHQLSTMKENLMQRQRELETFSPTDLE